jgi:predicted nucleotide-binding protein
MRKPSRARPVQAPAQVTPEEIRLGIDLTKRLEEVRAFDPASVVEQNSIPHVEALGAAVDESLIRTFGADTLDYRRYSDAGFFDNGPFNYAYQVPISKVHESLSRSKARSIALLTQAIKSLRERLTDYSDSSSQQFKPNEKSYERKIFVVHGRDNEAKIEVARFLERIDFEPIILHEQANQGRTLIEKMIDHGEVGFAVVLLTPDDEGNKKGEPARPRARQNVILELGYFLGRLGRDRVCALKRGEVEIPSDFDGVVYEPLDEFGGWRSKLAKELDAAKYVIDWAKVHK